MRVAIVIAKTTQAKPSVRTAGTGFQPDNQLGLVEFMGTVVAPRPSSPWRRNKPNAGGERRR
jgi:hypothetical protein